MTKTVNFNLNLTPLDSIPWKEESDDNMHIIDTVLKQFININNVKGVWKNALVVAAGDRYVDDVTDTLWEVLIAHTTHSTNAFSVDRANNPTFWESISGIGPADFDSGNVNITADTEHEQAHSLGALPALGQVLLRCTITEHGYSVGDYVILGSGVDADVGVTVLMNSTNIEVVVGSAINILSITTNNSVAITLASWKLVMRAWA